MNEVTLAKLPDMLSITSVAKLLHLPPKTIRIYIESNEIPALKEGYNYMIPKDWLLDILDIID